MSGTISREEVSLPERFRFTPWIALALGCGFLGLSYGMGSRDPAQLWHSYLVAFLFFVSLSVGGLFFVLLQFVTRAGWSVAVRRLAEHVMGTMPVMALLAVPLASAIGVVYPWANPETVASDPLLAEKSVYLNVGFFTLRAVVYLVGWSAVGWWFRRQSLRQDDSGDLRITHRLQLAAPVALVFFGVTVTMASFDWIMSLDPYWYSTIYGVYFFAGSVVGILALVAATTLALQRLGVLRDVVSAEHLHDMGKLLFGFVAFWAYIAFSQFMLIWYANIPEETIWFAHRFEHGWGVLTWVLALGHFVIPFFFLLPRSTKRRPATLFAASIWLLAMHHLDLYWQVMPHLHGDGPVLHALDLLTFLGIGGIFLGSLGALMRSRALVPVGDPRLAESLHFEST